MLKAKLEMFVTLSGIMTDCNDEQHPNASMPMSLTLAGIAIEERAPHESKRALGKRSIPLPKTTAFKPEPVKAPKPRLMTESGMTTESRCAQPSKARTPILVTVLGMVMDE